MSGMSHRENAFGAPRPTEEGEMAPRPHGVGVLVVEGMKMLDLSGPAEVFPEANRYAARYRLSIVSPDGAAVRSSIGMPVPADADARSPAENSAWPK